MKITSNTLYADFAQYEDVLTEESKADLLRAADQYYKPCHMLTLDEFWGLTAGNYELIGLTSEEQATVFQYYWVQRFKSFVEEFAKSCERLSMKDKDSDAISKGCVKIQPQENMLIFAREYFGLSSFVEAGKVTIGEYILARKDRYNTWLMKKNSEQLQIAALKNKNKR